MIIQNREILATTDLRRKAIDILEAGVERVLPARVMGSVSFDRPRKILTVQNNVYHITGRIFVIGGGKASGLMVASLEAIIGPEDIVDGVVTCKSSSYAGSKVAVVEAGHPIPDQRGVDGVRRMLNLKEDYAINMDDLVICLISGGGSALMPCPAEGIRLEDKRQVTELLFTCGADINQINTVRKHLSATKGGQLAEHFAPATVVSLVLSDVIGNDLSTIASGTGVPDPSTYADAVKILESLGLMGRIPRTVREFLRNGVEGLLPETPKRLQNAHSHIIGDNSIALVAMARKAAELDLRSIVITAEQKGDTSTAAWVNAGKVLSAGTCPYDVYLIGGETTPRLPIHHGQGGRNQHYVAVSLLAMAGGAEDWVIASLGTDGSDFLPDVAGAMVDNNSLATLQNRGIRGTDVKSHLERYDSNTLLKRLGNSLIITGDTGTNVGDVMLYLVKRGKKTITPNDPTYPSGGSLGMD